MYIYNKLKVTVSIFSLTLWSVSILSDPLDATCDDSSC